MNIRKTILVLFVILLVGGLAVWWYSGFTLDFMRFFASDSGTPTTVRLYPVFDQATSKVRFVLETGTYEITGFQFRAGISAATFTNIPGFTGSAIFNQILEPAHLLSDGSLSFAAGILSSGTGATTTTTIATIDYTTLSADTAATQICVTVDMANTIVSARGVDTNVLDMSLNGWSNKACTSTVTPTGIGPKPSAPPGCYYQEVQCIQAPCDPVLVCPSCQPRPACLDTVPACKIAEPDEGWCPPGGGRMVSCGPETQTVKVGSSAQVSAAGGNGTYEWFAPEGNPTNRLPQTATFSVSYATAGTKKVTVQSPRGDGSSNVDSVACTVVVTQ